MKTGRRNRFIEEVNLCSKPKFVYQHLILLHELNNAMGTCWMSDDYAKNVEVMAKEFEKIYFDYDIGKNDLVIIGSDHGVILDMDFIKDTAEKGHRQYEQSVKAFFALIGNDIPAQCLSRPISALDEASTILHLALGEKIPVFGQGMDQYDYVFYGKYQSNIFFREVGTWGTLQEMINSVLSDSFYLRDGKWKYVWETKEPQSEWLMDLEENQDYEVNLIGKYPEIAKKYRQMLEDKFGQEGVKGFLYQSPFAFTKADIVPTFSLILDMDDMENATIESLLDMSGPYYELVVKESEMTLKYRDQYKMRYVKNFDPETLRNHCRGEWIVWLTENGEWSEYFLSDLYRYIQCHRNRNVKIRGEHYVAGRKEEAENFEGNILYEEKRVRDIRYLHRDDMDKKYIFFGCGDIGKEAVDYFGTVNVAFFVDNNAGMTGREVCGKRVLSFDEMKAIHQDYTIMITTKAVYANEISRQLDDNGIHDYWRFEEYERREPDSCWASGFRVVRESL